MKYQITYDPDDENGLIIHVRRRLVKDQIICVDPTDDLATAKEELLAASAPGVDLAGFYTVLRELDGMTSTLMVEQYTLFLEKGSLYGWEELQGHMVAALQFYISPDEDLEEVPHQATLVEGEEVVRDDEVEDVPRKGSAVAEE